MPTLDVSHAWEIKINGVDVTHLVDPGSMVMTDAEGVEVDTLYFELSDANSALQIHSWQAVQWVVYPTGSSKLEWFGGLIVSAETSALEGALGRLWRIKAEGYQTLLARAAVEETVYVGQPPGNIVLDILDRAGLTIKDENQNDLEYKDYDKFIDTGQDFNQWATTTGDSRYALVVSNLDGTQTWGYIGAAAEAGQMALIYQDITRDTPGWNGADPTGKTPVSYMVRRAYQFSGQRPIDTTNVVTGSGTVAPFATDAEESLPATLTRLATERGWVWRLSADAMLYFGPASNDPAPFAVSDGANADYTNTFPALAGSVTVNRNGMEMINQVVIHGGAKESGLIEESFVYSTGQPTVFRLAHRNLIDITVWLNGVVVADGTVWWHTFDDYVVLVNYAEGWIWFNTLANDDGITVRYHYYEELVYTLRDEASIAAARQVFTKRIWDRSITSTERAAAVAQAVLDEYGPEITTGSFEVWRLGLRAGQLVHLTFDEHGVDGDYVIRKLDCRIDVTYSGLACFIQFGGRTTTLSAMVNRAALAPDVHYGNFANLTNVTLSQPQKPLQTDGWLSKRDTTMADASGGALTVTLPPAIMFRGRTVRVVKVDASNNSVYVEPSVGETINGSSSAEVNKQWNALMLFSTGSDWIAWLMSDE